MALRENGNHALKKTWLLALIPVAALGWWAYQRHSAPPEVPFTNVKRETLISTLPTNGKLEPLEWAAARANTAGIIEKLWVQQGQSVQKSARLVELRAPGLPAELSSAEARVAQARAELQTLERGGKSSDLAEIESNLTRARSDLLFAQRDYSALRRLAAKQAATAVDVEAAREKVQQAELDIKALEAKRAALVSSADKTAARARVQEAGAAQQLVRSRVAQTIVQAPTSGVVYDLPARTGAYLNAGDLVAAIGRLDRLRVRVYVDEPELGRVAAGQPATITWDALPGKQWDGVVEKLPTEIVPLGTRQVGEVLCTIENKDRRLVPGTNVNVEIQTSAVESALTIPKEVLRRESNAVGVLLLQGNRVVWRRVKTGVSSVTRVQVMEGLAEGDSVALSTETPPKKGDVVKPVYP